jgi:hypothetical protein
VIIASPEVSIRRGLATAYRKSKITDDEGIDVHPGCSQDIKNSGVT